MSDFERTVLSRHSRVKINATGTISAKSTAAKSVSFELGDEGLSLPCGMSIICVITDE